MAEKIKLVFLGTSDAVPSASRNHTSILLTFKGENILVDCGEGTQRQFRKAKLNPLKVTRILITHWHGDHVLGIPGLLQTLALNDYSKTLYIYGPKGTKKFMRSLLNTFVFVNKFPIKVFEINKPGKFLDENDFYLELENMTHGTPTNAYSFVNKGKVKIDKNKLKKTKLPQSPILKGLKQGKDITYKGKKFKAKDLTYMDNSRKISFVLDTNFNNKIADFVKDSDLLISESTYASDLTQRAKDYNHLTAKQAGEIAKKAKVKKLILTHISQRYENDTKKILNDAKKVFKNSHLASDLDVLEI